MEGHGELWSKRVTWSNKFSKGPSPCFVDYRQSQVECFYASWLLCPASSTPSERPAPAGLLVHTGCVPCLHTPTMAWADASKQMSSLVHSAIMGTRIGFHLFFCPLPCPRKSILYLGTLLVWKGKAEGVRGRRVRGSSLLQFLWLSPEQEQWWLVLGPAQPSVLMVTVIPYLLRKVFTKWAFTSFLCLSQTPCEAMVMKGRDWLLCGISKIEIWGLFSFLPGVSCYMLLDRPEQKGA